MKTHPLLATLFCGVMFTALHAETFSIGGMKIEVPVPQEFARVTRQIEEAFTREQIASGQTPSILAIFIPEANLQEILLDNPIGSERQLTFSFLPDLVDAAVSAQAFNTYKHSEIKAVKDWQRRVQLQLRQAGADINVLDAVLKITPIFPLGICGETALTISSSFLTQPPDRSPRRATTVITVDVAGKVVMLVCAALAEDLEWTREIADAWAEASLAANPAPPPDTPADIARARAYNVGKTAGLFCSGLVTLILGLPLLAVLL